MMKNQWVKYFRIPWTWKGVELEAYDNPKTDNGSDRIDTWNLEIRRRRRIDHAGIEFELEGTERVYHLSIYDTRHWNSEEERWKEYNWSDKYNDYVPAE